MDTRRWIARGHALHVSPARCMCLLGGARFVARSCTHAWFVPGFDQSDARVRRHTYLIASSVILTCASVTCRPLTSRSLRHSSTSNPGVGFPRSMSIVLKNCHGAYF